MQTDRFAAFSLRDHRIRRILEAALAAVEPGRLVANALERLTLSARGRRFVLAMGKAAEPMAAAAIDKLDRVSGGLVVTKQELHPHRTIARAAWGAPAFGRSGLRSITAGHPVPDERSLRAGEAVFNLVRQLHSDDVLICLLSGGASALVTRPIDGINLQNMQDLTRQLLRAGATIDEVNAIRRRLDLLKGGGLAKSTEASILALILSDVIGDRLASIASGPTSPDPTSRDEVLEILGRYRIEVPRAILDLIDAQTQPSPHAEFGHVTNIIVGNNSTALDAAARAAVAQGFASEIIDRELRGEAHLKGKVLADALTSAAAMRSRPFCLLAGGETTVTLDADGKGGRNQELALAAVDKIAGMQNVALVTLATDGNDGPTDAAGAVATGESAERAARAGLRAGAYLARHDSYLFFEALEDLLKPGYTGTNVNDLVLLCGL